MIHALNAGNGVGSGNDVVLDLAEHLGKELEGISDNDAYLVGNTENKAGGVRNDVHNVWHGNNILGKTESIKIRTVKKPTDLYVQKKGYFTFSWSVLMISDSFLSPIISSYTHILMVSSKHAYFFALLPIIMASAEALYIIMISSGSNQLPLPIIATRSFTLNSDFNEAFERSSST